MNENKKYIEKVAITIFEKILSMNNVDRSKVDNSLIFSIALKAANDLLKINVAILDDYGYFDEFSAKQLADNCRVGELQIYFDNFNETKIIVSRFGSEDLSDISIQLISEDENGNTISVNEDKNGSTYIIKGIPDKEIRFQNGQLIYYDGDVTHIFTDINEIDLSNMINWFNTGLFDKAIKDGEKMEFTPLIEEGSRRL